MRLQMCMYPIVQTVLALRYDVKTKRYCYFNYTPDEETLILKKFPWFKDLIATFHIIGFPVQSLRFDTTEIAFLCAIKLLFESKCMTSLETLIFKLIHQSRV